MTLLYAPSATGSFADLLNSQPATPMEAPASWSIQDAILRDLWTRGLSPEVIATQLNRTVPAIMTRAARLGLPRRAAPGRKRMLRSPEQARERQVARNQQRAALVKEALVPREGAALRVCLMCVAPFQSQGRHNRICPKCKGSPDYEAGARLPDLDFGTL